MGNAWIKYILLYGVFFSTILYGKVLTVDELSKKYEKNVKSIDTNGLVELLKEKPNTRIIDVREIKDIIQQGGRIKANRVSMISRGMLEFSIGNIVKPEEEFVVHCYLGGISLFATKALQDMGYKNVIWYKDSFKGWKDANLEIRSPDFYPESMLYSKVQKTTDDVYTSIGELGPGTYENTGHNNNLAFIIGEKGIVVWNAGSTYLLAQAFHEEIKKISNKPILYVVIENSQMHAAGGMNYWQEYGAKIIAHENSAKNLPLKAKLFDARGERVYKDKYLKTKPSMPDITFQENYVIDLGNIELEAKYFGHAHEHDDIALWYSKKKILFGGDLTFHQRLLPIFEITDMENWIDILDKIESLNPKIIVPGHGDVTDMQNVKRDTKDYLIYLTGQIQTILDNDGDIIDAYKMDMSKYEHMDTYDLLGRQNIAKAWGLMEF